MIGAAMWVVGFYFEAAGDAQLTSHKADPAMKGKLCRAGVWRFTRHPNYFGDALMWWGIWVYSLGTPGGAKTVYSALTITFLLRYVSGVAMLERA